MSGFPTVDETNDFETRIAVCAAVLDISGGSCPCDLILTLTRTSSTSFRVSFDRPVVNNPYLTIPANWSVRDEAGVAPPLQVISVTPEGVGAPSYIDLVTSEQRTGVQYIAEAYILEAD